MNVLSPSHRTGYRREWSLSLVLFAALAVPVAGRANPVTTFDLDGDGKNETTASSARVAAGDLQNDFYDTISVGNPHAFTSLSFDWQLPDAYRFKGGLPVGAKWTDTNHYDSYITPFEFSYSLSLTPAGCPAGVGCPATTKTADAWTPVNGYKLLKSIRDLFSVAEVEGDVRSEEDIAVKVWSRATPVGSLVRYDYFAQNATSSSVDLSWLGYSSTRDNAVSFIDGLVLPGQTKLLKSLTTAEDPAEIAGQVRATVAGNEVWFIAPMIVPVPEPASALLIAGGLAALGWRQRRRRAP